jgi:hypothetical protein
LRRTVVDTARRCIGAPAVDANPHFELITRAISVIASTLSPSRTYDMVNKPTVAGGRSGKSMGETDPHAGRELGPFVNEMTKW